MTTLGFCVDAATGIGTLRFSAPDVKVRATCATGTCASLCPLTVSTPPAVSDTLPYCAGTAAAPSSKPVIVIVTSAPAGRVKSPGVNFGHPGLPVMPSVGMVSLK